MQAYQRHLTTRSVDNEEFGIEDDHINLDADMEQAREESETTGNMNINLKQFLMRLIPCQITSTMTSVISNFDEIWHVCSFYGFKYP